LREHPEVLDAPITGELVFHTLSGEVRVDVSSKEGNMTMSFPADPPVAVKMQTTKSQVAGTLGLQEDDILNIEISKKLSYVVIEVAQSVDIKSMDFNPTELVNH
jgi:predicted PhzF superfamily epimerase YddE/YHI9